MTDDHTVRPSEFENFISEAHIGPMANKTSSKPVKKNVPYRPGTCYFKSFEDIVTSGSKQRYSRDGIISKTEQKKSVEQVEVASNLTNPSCQYSMMDEYKALFDLPTCTPVYSHSAQDSQLPANKEKGLEEIDVSHSPTNSCCHYSKMDEYKSLFGLPTCTPVHFLSDQDSQLSANKGKGLGEIEVSQSPTNSCCHYSKMDEYKSLFGLPTCNPIHFHSAQDLQLPANKRKNLKEIEVSQSPTNELFMLLILSGSQCLAGVVPRDSQSCSMLEGFHQNSSMEDAEPLKPNSLGYDLFLYKAIMNQEDVCLAVKFQDQCCTALDFLNTDNSLIEKEIDFFEYELYRYLMEPEKWCFMELLNDSQSCSLLERFDGLTSEENPGVLRPDLRNDFLIYKAIMKQENICLAVKCQDQCCTPLEFLSIRTSLTPDDSNSLEYDLYRHLMAGNKWSFIEQSVLDRCFFLQYLATDPKVVGEDLTINESHSAFNAALYYQLMTNFTWCNKDENIYNERHCLPEHYFSNASRMQERDTLILYKRTSRSQLLQMLMTSRGISFPEDHSTAGHGCDVISYYCLSCKDTKKQDLPEESTQLNLALYQGLLSGFRFCLASDVKLHTSSNRSLLFDHFFRDFQFVDNATKNASTNMAESSSCPEQYLTFTALAQGLPISFPKDNHLSSYCTWFNFNVSSKRASALSGKAATQDDTNFVISVYEEIMMSQWTCSMYFDKTPSCLFHDSHPQEKHVDQKSQDPKKSEIASKPKRKRKKRRRGDISVKDKQATFKSIIDSFSLCKVLHESDYRSVCPWLSHLVSQIMENSIVYTNPVVDITIKRRSMYSSLQVIHVLSGKSKTLPCNTMSIENYLLEYMYL